MQKREKDYLYIYKVGVLKTLLIILHCYGQKNMKNIIFIILFPLFGYSQNFSGTYNCLIEFDGTPVYRNYTLKLNTDSTFISTKFAYESCYTYSDTVEGKWDIDSNKICFYDIKEKIQINKIDNSLIKSNYIKIEENCMDSDILNTDSTIRLIAIDSNYQIIDYLKPKTYQYLDEQSNLTGGILITTYEIPIHSHQLIYLNSEFTIPDNYFEGGYNLIDFKSYNTYKINYCEATSKPSSMFISPLMKFKILNNNNLESLQTFREIDGKYRKRVFKKISP